MRLKAIALVAVLSGGFASEALAITVARAPSPDVSAVTHVDFKKQNQRHMRQKYRAGGRYNRAPANWHRFDKRPGDWQRRGCVIVGPIWWCP